MMPVLAVLIVVIALYSLTIPGALAGVKYYLMPDFSQFSASTVLGACGQMFYSMSLAMGITITYGSYMPKENLLEHSVTQIEIFDTLFAFFAGLMIIPAVIAFNGGDPSQVNSGPSLMFISLPMVFDSMKFGTVIGAVFFLLVLFAALTSSIALMETLASVIMDKFKLKRIPATLIIIAICLVVGMLSCLGYGPWESVTIIGMQFLDFFDFISNSVLMPIVAVLTCVLIGHVVGTRVVADEVKSGAGSFHREKAAPRHDPLDRADPAGRYPCFRARKQDLRRVQHLILPVEKLRFSDKMCSDFAEHESSESSHTETFSLLV